MASHLLHTALSSSLHALSSAWQDNLAAFLSGLSRTLAAFALVAAAMLLSHLNSLGLATDMLVSSLRAFMQLSAIGFVLNFLFTVTGAASLPLIFVSFCFMTAVAGHTVAARAALPALRLAACASIFTGSLAALLLLLLLGIFPPTPRFLIPVTGMMVGNAMTATGVALRRLKDGLRENVARVEAALALGATPLQATAMQRGRALTVALAPILDSTKTEDRKSVV